MPAVVAAGFGGRPHGAAHAAFQRPGTTVAELTVVIVLMSLMVGGMLSVIDRQQRLHRHTSNAAGTRRQVQQAATILPAELRGISPQAGDILEALDSALEFRATIGTGVICERGDEWIALAPLRADGEPALRGELVAAEPGDLVHVLLPDDTNPELDRWPGHRIVEATDDVGVCGAGDFIDAVTDAGRARLRLTLAPAPATDILAGAPVRITRPVRYSLYRSSDRRWYLGARDQGGGAWSGIQPVSGPYAPYGQAGGVEFAYLDPDGVRLPPDETRRVARITLSVRGESPTVGAPASDSARLDVALRNRRQ